MSHIEEQEKQETFVRMSTSIDTELFQKVENARDNLGQSRSLFVTRALIAYFDTLKTDFEAR